MYKVFPPIYQALCVFGPRCTLNEGKDNMVERKKSMVIPSNNSRTSPLSFKNLEMTWRGRGESIQYYIYYIRTIHKTKTLSVLTQQHMRVTAVHTHK